MQENDEEAPTVTAAAEVAVRRVEAPAVQSQEHFQEEINSVASFAESSEPDLIDLTEEELDELEAQRLDEQDTTTSQFTVDLDGRMKRRLDQMIRTSRRSGRRLTITAVVLQALEQNRRHYGEAVSVWRHKNAPVTEGRLFSPSEDRQWVGRSLDATTSTITVRPTLEERVLIERAVLLSGARTRKEFIEAVLDTRLPQLPGRPPKA
ncbi:hypothetical protein ABZ234_08215 [Nocardiopsis sp. NPDC006198]|uniref:hypothetical protein n=1 Tax=Nocardiopsis sp. NPDC006198 TaxID=3154472 RepID=UPI0033A85702